MYFKSLSRREQEIVAFFDVVQPLSSRSTQEEESMDLCFWQHLGGQLGGSVVAYFGMIMLDRHDMTRQFLI